MNGASTGYRPLYANLADRVVRDRSWKVYGACGQRPKQRCTKCKRFDSTAVRCKCKNPQFVEVTEEMWTSFWFPERGVDFLKPKTICNNDCPARKACLAYALEEHIVFGVWGGYTERERRRLRMNRDLFVVCVYCNGKVKAGQWTRKTCNRQVCKDRWAADRRGAPRAGVRTKCENCSFEMVTDLGQSVCNAQKCRDWLAMKEDGND